MTSSNQTIKPYTDAELNALEASCGPGEPTVLRLVHEVRRLRTVAAIAFDDGANRWRPLMEALRWDAKAFGLFVESLLAAKRVEDLPSKTPAPEDFAAQYWKEWAGYLFKCLEEDEWSDVDRAKVVKAGIVECEEPK